MCRELVAAAVRSYLQRMAGYARMAALHVWYDLKGVDDLLGHHTADARRQAKRGIARAWRRGHRRAVAKNTMIVAEDGSAAEVQRSGTTMRFRADPPLQVHLESTSHQMEEALETYESYRASVPDDKRVLLSRYRIGDVARRVVGVGSVGTLVWVCLLEAQSRGGDDRIVLQVKQAQPSMLERGLTEHATLCAWALARGHARSGDAAAISGYLGGSDGQLKGGELS